MRDRSLWTYVVVTIALLWLPGLAAVLATDKFTSHLWLNQWHGPVADKFFPAFTELANGWVPVALSLLLLWKNWRSFLMMGLSTGLSAILVQTLKHGLYPGHDRPSMFLDQMPGLPLVGGVDLHHHFSFPSGHSTAAYSMCLALAVVAGRPRIAVLLALLAALLGYSRIYLSQHFLQDVLAGAALGTAMATAVYFLLYRGRWSADGALGRSPFRRQNQ